MIGQYSTKSELLAFQKELRDAQIKDRINCLKTSRVVPSLQSIIEISFIKAEATEKNEIYAFKTQSYDGEL